MNRSKSKKGGNAHKKQFSYETGSMAKGFKVWSGSVDLDITKSGATEVVNLQSVTSVASNALGVMAAEITTNPNTTTEWASFAARYREYRVLAVEFHWVPNNIVNTTGLVGAAMAVAQNKAAALGTPSGYGQLFSMAVGKIKHVFKPFKYLIAADDITDLDMGGTATPGSEFSFLFYSDGLTASTTYGRFFTKWVVQFSSRQ